MTLKITAADAIAACNTLTGRLNTGADHPTLEIYDGVEPANLSAAVTTQVLLVELPLAGPQAFQGAVDVPGASYVEASANPVADTPALADGEAAWFRVFDDTGAVRWQGQCSEANLGGDLELSSLNIIQGVNVVTVNLRARMPKSE